MCDLGMKVMDKIIFVTVSMRGGGTERVISILANRMVSMGFEVEILMIADSAIEYYLDKRIRVSCISEATGGSLSGRIRRIINMRKDFLRDTNAHIISMGTVANMFTLLAAFGLRNQVTISERNDPNRLNHRPIKKHEVIFRNFLYKWADKIVLQTPDVMGCFPNTIQKKCVVIPNPVPESMPTPYPVDEREKTVLTAGRLTEQKNHKMLLNVFAEFSKQFPDYHLYIFGRGELEIELAELIHSKQLEEKVTLRGFSDELYYELGKGGIYVSTSNWEGISNSLLEALAMGIPTIATDCPMGGARLCIEDGVNGYLIPPRNEDVLLERLVKLASEEYTRSVLSRNAMMIREKYSEVVITKSWCQK